MSKVLKTIQIDTEELKNLENYFHKTELVLSGKVPEVKIEEIQNIYLKIHDERIALEAKVKEANLGNVNLQIGVVGSFSTGKSSFLNSLIGEDLLGTDLMPTTAKITKLIYGKNLRLFKVSKEEQINEITLNEYKEFSVHSNNEDSNASDIKSILSNIKYFKVEYPSPFLEKFTLIDTPGFSSTSKEDDELTMSMIPELDVLLWLFDANKTGDADEMKLINHLGKDTKIFAIINKIDLKSPSARDKILQDLSSRYPFEEIFLYSSKKVFERTNEQKKLREIWSSLFEEILSNEELDFKEVSIKFKKTELSIGESNFKIKNLNQNGFEQYHSVLSLQLENLRQGLRSIFESLFKNELENLINVGREKIAVLVRHQRNLLKNYEIELIRLENSQEELFQNLAEIQQGVFETYFGEGFYNQIFSGFFEFESKNGWIASTDSLQLKEVDKDRILEDLINKFEIFLGKTLEQYGGLLDRLIIKNKSKIFSEGENELKSLKALCNKVLDQASLTFTMTAEHQYFFEVKNRDEVKDEIKKEFFYSSPIELIASIVDHFIFNDFIDIFFDKIYDLKDIIKDLKDNIELIETSKNYG